MKKTKRVGKIIKSVLLSLLAVIIVGVMIGANTMLSKNERMVNNVLGRSQAIDSSQANSEGVNLNYNESDYSKDEIAKAEEELNEKIAGEGIVLLKNDNDLMPFEKGTRFSFLGASSETFIDISQLAKIAKPSGHLTSLKAGFESKGFSVNEKLWDFYSKGKGKDYGVGKGSLSYGADEDFSINEAPLSLLQSEEGLVESIEGTVPVYVLRRVAGEGRDMPRSMYNHADKKEDQVKSYLEPDSNELEILQYLNDHFENAVVILNSNAALELDWLQKFPNIRSAIYAPSVGSVGINALANIFAGNVNPSGRTVDTFAADALASPAAQNFGSYLYHKEDGSETKYNYISYKEGIYVGYKYYETRYEDAVLGQGNAGKFNYASEVVYPFGYGLSYTTFEWSNYQNSWDGAQATVQVDVTNTGDVAGKDVVQVYAQTPYTEYDKKNKIEKPSVNLVGYGKTDLLEPGQTETVTITFDQEQLKAYDYVNAKTFILDAGTYYITAATDAHNAVNNVLAMKEKAVTDGMTADGNKNLVATYTPDNVEVDTTTFAKDTLTGTEIKNQFDEANGNLDYMTRNDWEGTFPTHDGMVSEKISTWGNEINGTDKDGNPAAYQYYKTLDDELLAKIDSTDSLSPVDRNALKDEMVYGADNNLSLVDMRGLDMDDPRWDDLLDQLKPEDYQLLITQSGYGLPRIESVNSPFSMDADNAMGLVYGGTGMVFSSTTVLAQTWNVGLAKEYGQMIGNEAILGGTNGWYAPAMNIHRTPFSGRNSEYYSEDAFLSGAVGAATTSGVAEKGVYAYLKHFALNDQENHRGDTKGQYGAVTWSNEQAIREIYLKPFEMSLKSGNVNLNYVEKNEAGVYENKTREIPAGQAVMTAFNRIGYTWTGGHYPLITGVLRNEWGFKGFVLTDNSNTGKFMDGYQMLEAGGDAKLTNIPEGARYTFNESDVADYHYGREAMKRILYTLANSKAMNGAMPGSVFKNNMQIAQMIQIGINVVGGASLLLMAYFLYRKFRRKKKLLITAE